MGIMTDKDQALDVIRKLPDDSDLDQIQYHLYVLETVQKGLRELDSGESLSHEQVREELKRWLN